MDAGRVEAYMFGEFLMILCDTVLHTFPLQGLDLLLDVNAQ